jgi:hypothetical protein
MIPDISAAQQRQIAVAQERAQRERETAKANAGTPKTGKTFEVKSAPASPPLPAGPGPVKPDQRYIDAVNKAGVALAKANKSGNAAEIANARKAYDAALMDEISSSYSLGGGSMPGYSVMLQDPKMIAAAAQQVENDHAGQTYDPNFAASVRATIIIDQALYAAGGPSYPGQKKVDSDQATAALQTVGSALARLDDPKGTVSALVMSDPGVKQYLQIVSAKAKSDEDLAKEVTTLARSSPVVAQALVDLRYPGPSCPRTNLLNLINSVAPPAKARPPANGSPVQQPSGSFAPPATLISKTNDDYQAYQKALTSGTPQQKAQALAALHTDLAAEADYAQQGLLHANPQMPTSNARDMAIKLVTTVYHTGQQGKDLLPAAEAAMVIADAQAAGQKAKPGLDTYTAEFKALASGSNGQGGGLSLYSDPAVTSQVLDDPRVQSWIDAALAAAPKSPGDALHYVAQLANASASSPALADKLVQQALPNIDAWIDQLPGVTGRLTQDKNEKQVQTAIHDLSDIVSAVRNEGDVVPGQSAPDSKAIISNISQHLSSVFPSLVKNLTPPIPARGVPNTGTQYMHDQISDLIAGGTDPTLVMAVGALQTDPAIKSAIFKGVADGTQTFFTKTYPDAIQKAGDSVKELTFLNANFGGLVNQNDPVQMKKYVDYINNYIKDHPDIDQAANNLQNLSLDAAKMMTAVGNNQGALKSANVANQINSSLEKFSNDPNNVTTLVSTPGVIDYFSRINTQVNSSFSGALADTSFKGLRLAFQRIGSVAAKRVAVQAANLALEGNMTGATQKFKNFNLSRYGLTDKLFGQDQQVDAETKLLKIASAQDNVGAAQSLLEGASTPADRAIATGWLNDANSELADALKDKPKLPLTWDGTTVTGLAVRGGGVALTMAGVWFALTADDKNAYNYIAAGAGTLSSLQTVRLLSLMSERGVAEPALAESLSSKIAMLDSWGDKMILFGPALSGYGIYTDIRDGNLPMLAIDSTSAAGGISAFLGTQFGATELGLAFSTAGLWLTAIAAAGLLAYAGWQQYKSVQASNQFENMDTERFLRDVVGIDNSKGHDLTRELRNCTHQGFGAGGLVQALATAAGYDLKNPKDLADYVHYLNSLTQEQMANLVSVAHSLIDRMDLKSQPTVADLGGAGTMSEFMYDLQNKNVPLPPAKLPALPPQPETPKPNQTVPYRIVTGDNLTRIAEKYQKYLLTNSEQRLPESQRLRLALLHLEEINPQVDENPDLIYPKRELLVGYKTAAGQDLPFAGAGTPQAKWRFVKVEPGGLFSTAKKYHVSFERIIELNPQYRSDLDMVSSEDPVRIA